MKGLKSVISAVVGTPGTPRTIVDIISASALDTRTLGHYLAFKNGRSFLITGNQSLHTTPSHYHYGDIDCKAFSKLSCSQATRIKEVAAMRIILRLMSLF